MSTCEGTIYTIAHASVLSHLRVSTNLKLNSVSFKTAVHSDLQCCLDSGLAGEQ